MGKAVHLTGWGVYLVRCADGSLYAGCTNRLQFRLQAHNAGKGARYTRSRRPVSLAYWRPVRGRSAALKAEAKLKALSRAQKLSLTFTTPVQPVAAVSAKKVRGPGRPVQTAPIAPRRPMRRHLGG